MIHIVLAFLRVRFDLNQVLSWKQLLEVGRKQEEKELEARSVIMIFPDAQEGRGGGSPNSSQVLVENGHSLHHP